MAVGTVAVGLLADEGGSYDFTSVPCLLSATCAFGALSALDAVRNLVVGTLVGTLGLGGQRARRGQI